MSSSVWTKAGAHINVARQEIAQVGFDTPDERFWFNKINASLKKQNDPQAMPVNRHLSN